MIHLSSRDRHANETPARASYGEYGEDGISEVGLSEFSFVTNFNNINSSNDTAVLDDGAQSYPIEIAHGNYDGAALALEIQTKTNLIVAPIVVSVTFGGNGRFTMTSTTAVKWTYPNPISGYRDFAQMAGLITPLLSTNIAGKLANLTYTNNLFITSRSLTSKQITPNFASNNQAAGVLGVVYLDVGTGTIKTRGVLTDINWIHTNPLDTIRMIDIEILDDYGNAIVADEVDNLSYDLTILTH